MGFVEQSKEAADLVRRMAWDKRRTYDEMDAEQMVQQLQKDLQTAKDGITEGFAMTYAIVMLIRDGNQGPGDQEQLKQLNDFGNKLGQDMQAVLLHMERVKAAISGLKA